MNEKKYIQMKRISLHSFFLLIALLGVFQITSSCISSEDEVITDYAYQSEYNENTDFSEIKNIPDINLDVEEYPELIKRLELYNDSVNDVRLNTSAPDGFFDFLRNIKVLLADAKGALVGAQYGVGFISRLVGAIIGAVIFSTVADAYYNKMPSSSMEDMTQRTKIETAYISAQQDSKLLSSIKNDLSVLSLNIPKEYEDWYDIGIMHNATLEKLYHPNPLTIIPDTSIGVSPDEFLSSPSYLNLYDKATKSPDVIYNLKPGEFGISLEKNLSSTEKNVFSLYMDAVRECTSAQEFTTISNDYVQMIQTERKMKTEYKETLFGSIITACCSMIYWSNQYETE